MDYDYGLVSGLRLGDAQGGRAELMIGSGGVAHAVVAVADDDQLIVQAGGIANNTRVVAGQAAQVVQAGGQASGTILAAEGAGELVFGTTRATVISGGGVEYVEAGGFTGGAVVSSGGMERISHAMAAFDAPAAPPGETPLLSAAGAAVSFTGGDRPTAVLHSRLTGSSAQLCRAGRKEVLRCRH